MSFTSLPPRNLREVMYRKMSREKKSETMKEILSIQLVLGE